MQASLRKALIAGVALVVSAAPCAARELGGDRQEIRISRLDRPPVLDEFLDMEPPADLQGQLTLVEGFIQRDPEDGNPASQRTRVYLGFDDRNLYAIFVAFDDEPQKIRARLMPREQVFGDETVEIQLDTFDDERRALTFLTNPFGIQWDAIWTEGQEFDSSWDSVWYSKGKLTDRGYVVLFSIPFTTLRFPRTEEQTWGLILVRDIPRNNETSFWPRVSNRIEGRLNQAARMTGLSGISPGRNISLIPYASARSFEIVQEDADPAVVSENFDTEVGLDAKIVIKDALALDLTANPDFSQVESDAPQVTVNQRFEVFFPERRPFFLENANYFETPFDLLFTRRIRDPMAGARLTGKLGPYALGALLIDDEAPGQLVAPTDPRHGERAWFSVARLSRDLGEQSTIGLMYTGYQFGDETNRVGAIDGRFKLGANWTTTFQAAHSRTVTPETGSATAAATVEQSDSAYSLQFDRSGRKFNAHLHYREIAPQFHTEAGYVPRTDTRDPHGSVSYTFRPEKRGLVAWGPELAAARIYDHEGTRLDSWIRPGIEWEFRGQTELELAYTHGRERLREEDFPGLPEATDFSTDGWNLEFRTAMIKSLSVGADVSVGDAINLVPPEGELPSQAERVRGDVELELRLGRRIRLDTTYLFNELSDKASQRRIFTNQILRARLNLQFTPRLSLRLIAQYDHVDPVPGLTRLERDESINGDVLVTYLVNPWTALYIGYNSNYRNIDRVQDEHGDEIVIRDDGLMQDAEQFFAKFSYLFRF